MQIIGYLLAGIIIGIILGMIIAVYIMSNPVNIDEDIQDE